MRGGTEGGAWEGGIDSTVIKLGWVRALGSHTKYSVLQVRIMISLKKIHWILPKPSVFTSTAWAVSLWDNRQQI